MSKKPKDLPDFSQCEKEPIHTPGAVQPFSIVIKSDHEQRIVAVSDNLSQIIDAPADTALGQHINDFEPLKDMATLFSAEDHDYYEWVRAEQSYSLRVIPDPDGGQIFELEKLHDSGLMASKFEVNIQNLGTQLVRLESQSELFGLLVERLRKITGYTRCMVYEFDEEFNGCVVAESVNDGLEPYLGLHYPATDIPAQARELYLKQHTRMIADANYTPVPLRSLTSVPVDLSSVNGRAISPVHITYMKNMSVKASLVMSLVVNGRLWGLIACHHSETPVYLDAGQRQAVDTLSVIASLSIERFEAQQAQAVKALLDEEMSALKLKEFLIAPGKNLTMLRQLMTLTQSDGVCWVEGDYIWQDGSCPDEDVTNSLIKQCEGKPDVIFYFNPIISAIPGYQSGAAAGACVIKLSHQPVQAEIPFYVVLFRKPVVKEITWAGNPHEKQRDDSLPGGISPRHSFAAWVEKKRDHAKSWAYQDQEAIRRLQVALIEASYIYFAEHRNLERKIINNSADFGVWSLDIRTRFLFWNKRMFDIYGADEASFTNKYEDWVRFVVERDRKKVSLAFEKAVFQRKPFQHSFSITNPKSGERIIRAYADLLLSPNGEPVKVIGTNIDITDQIAASTAAIESLALSSTQSRLLTLGELAATMGHEINNPLAIIISTLELEELMFIQSDPFTLLPEDTQTQVKKYNDTIRSAAVRIEKIIGGLRKLARQPDENSKSETTNVATVIADVAELLTTLYKKENVRITWEAVDNTLNARIETSTLQQILVNLINNASDAMQGRDDKCVVLRAYSKNDKIVIDVEDTGSGIPQELAERVFTPFFSTKPMNKGTGLGLSISRSIAREAGGDLTFSSVLGEGTTFTLFLPRVTETQSVSKPDSVQKQFNYTLLVVDDEPDLLSSIAGLVSHLGCHVVTADSALHALDLLKRYPVDVVLTDLHLQGMSGYKLLDKTAEYDVIRVLMTGDTTIDETSEECRSRDVFAVLPKPVSLSHLVKLFARIEARSLDDTNK